MSTVASTFKPYEVLSSGRKLASVVDAVNSSNYDGYSTDTRVGGVGKVVVGTFEEYRHLIQELCEIPSVEFVTHRQLLTEPLPQDRVRVSIRHDIDSDIIAAGQQALIEQEHGVVTSWYVLHTAPYYGEFRDGVLHRHDCMSSLYLGLQDAGHEVALHTDPLWIYQEFQRDGAQAVTREIEWLRSEGLDIRGTVAHNSKPVYGAYNFEIFKGRYDYQDKRPRSEIQDHVNFRDVQTPLRVLDEEALGLEYEGNDALHDHDNLPFEYGATRGLDRWRWIRHSRFLKDNPDSLETAFLDQARVIHGCRQVQPGTAIILVVHPCYYGGRDEPFGGPTVQKTSHATAMTGSGCMTWKPGTMQTACSPCPDAADFQSISMVNELGALDDPQPPENPRSPWPEITIVGADNIDGRCVGSRIHLNSRIKEICADRSFNGPRVLKLGFPGMAFSRLVPRFEDASDGRSSRILVAGIGGDLIARERHGRSLLQSHLLPDLKADGPGYQIKQGKLILERNPSTSRGTQPQADLAAKLHLGSDAFSEESDFGHLVELYAAITQHLASQNVTLIFLIDELGESLHGAQTDDSTAKARIRDRLLALSDRCGTTLIDPYEEFDISWQERGIAALHNSPPVWNETGHRIAGELLFGTLLPLFEAAKDQPDADTGVVVGNLTDDYRPAGTRPWYLKRVARIYRTCMSHPLLRPLVNNRWISSIKTRSDSYHADK